MIVPPALQPGDPVRVVAPAGPFDPTLAWRGIAWLSTRYRVRFDRSMFRSTGYLAGSDQRRRDELEHAIFHDDCRAVLAVRGGYGLSRFAHQLDWTRFAASPKWIVGFSDVTALHVECAAVHVMSLHATMVAHLGRSDDRSRTQWVDAIEHPRKTRTVQGLSTWNPGSAEGPLFGGNLTMLHACAAAGRLRVPEHAILFLEDVGERPYRVDRAITTLRVGGYFDHVAAVVLGHFTDCFAGPDGVNVEQALRQTLQPLGVPIAWGICSGHSEPNQPLLLGSHARLDASEQSASLTTSA